ncbi:hypothetical protein [Paraburkholderia flava]|uniref:hypothetical protein n=1 Tax=Paraburkholderia flava TaxID=2547393 RepID=UPI00105C23E6|nr:hypothetical protein [Paraburkholderia flava]
MQKSKLVSEQIQEKRGLVFAKFFGVLGFSMFMLIPLINAIVGMFIVIFFAMKIIAASAQRAADLSWLLVGAAVCMFGFFLPALCDGPTSAGMKTGFFLEFVLNICVAVFIVGGKLSHLLKPAGQA